MAQRETVVKSLGIMSLSLVVFAALVFGILSYCSPQMEGDIRVASLKALHGLGMSWTDIEVSRRVITLSGIAPTQEASARAEAMLESRWTSAQVLNEVKVLPPLSPYRMEARYDGESLKVNGYVSTNAAARHIVEAVSFTDKRLEMRLDPREGQPLRWADDIAELLRFMLLMDSGELELKDRSISLVGGIPTPDLATRFDDLKLRYENRGYQFSLDLAMPPPPLSCADRLNAVSRARQFKFVGMGASVSPESFESLNEVAAVVRDCEDVYVEILGHCDIAGSHAHNLLLSQQRADSVKDYLITVGVNEAQLIAQGYGESARNRNSGASASAADDPSIEFRVVTP